MSPRTHYLVFTLAMVLALGVAVLVVISRRSGNGGDGTLPTPEPGMSVSRPGWNLSLVPAYGPILREEAFDQGVILQVTGNSEGAPIEDGQPVDIEYRVHTLDGALRGRGVLPNIALGTHNALPTGLAAGMAGITMFEKRRVLLPAGQAQSPVFPSLPPHRAAVFDIRPVRLRITDLVQGTGREVQFGDVIFVAFKGTLEDGRVFDASERAKVYLQTGKVIRGWSDGVPGMKVGGKRRLWVPSHLAYGAAENMPESGVVVVPPFADLVFEIEILEAKPAR